MTPEQAELYALVHDGAPGDLDFYRRLCSGASRVLELGSGTGRVSRALAAEGLSVTGLERDPGMLEVARRDSHPSIRYVEGDMTDFALGERFDRIVLPFTGIYCLETSEAVDRCFARVAEHLTDEGFFAFDAYSADAFHAECRPEDQADEQLDEVARIEHRGLGLTVLERSTWERRAQRMLATYLYRREDGTTYAELSIVHRYILSEQVRSALGRSGLSLVGMHGSFEGAPYEASESGTLLVIAERAEPSMLS